MLDVGLFAATAGKLRHCAAILRAIGELYALRHCHPDQWHSNFLIDEGNMDAISQCRGGISEALRGRQIFGLPVTPDESVFRALAIATNRWDCPSPERISVMSM
ncbi:hypothetical protein JMM51_08465 [Rhodovulum sulfidophilum]|nr:hypothetical protein [Rhodovulum sulfidophilum]